MKITKEQKGSLKLKLSKILINLYKSYKYLEQNQAEILATAILDKDFALDKSINTLYSEIYQIEPNIILITKPITHEVIAFRDVTIEAADFSAHRNGIRTYDIGKVWITLDQYLTPSFTFADGTFKHGHISDGRINCWGTYRNPHELTMSFGFSAALLMLHSFCKYSRYKTHKVGEVSKPYVPFGVKAVAPAVKIVDVPF